MFPPIATFADGLVGPVAATPGPVALLVAVVLGVPPLVAAVGAAVRRDRAARYAFAAAASLVAVFTLTGAVGFATHWAVLGILAVLSAIAAHVLQFRADRLDLLVASAIYAVPAGLGIVLLFGTLGVVRAPA